MNINREYKQGSFIGLDRRYWEMDYIITDGTPDVFYNGNFLPGDPPSIKILGGRVETVSKRGRRKFITLDKEYIETKFDLEYLYNELTK